MDWTAVSLAVRVTSPCFWSSLAIDKLDLYLCSSINAFSNSYKICLTLTASGAGRLLLLPLRLISGTNSANDRSIKLWLFDAMRHTLHSKQKEELAKSRRKKFRQRNSTDLARFFLISITFLYLPGCFSIGKNDFKRWRSRKSTYNVKWNLHIYIRTQLNGGI